MVKLYVRGSSGVMAEQHPPRVFISYSHDNVEHQERVLGLAENS